MSSALIKNKLRSLVPNGIKGTVTNVIANSSLSSLLGPLNSYVATLQERQTYYDVVSMGLSGCEEIIDDVEDLTDKINYEPHVTIIDKESAEMLSDTISNAAELSSDSISSVTNQAITLTSTAGQVYAFRKVDVLNPSTGAVSLIQNVTKTGTVDILTKAPSGEYKLNTRFCPISSMHSDYIASLGDIFSEIKGAVTTIAAYNAIVTLDKSISEIFIGLKDKLHLYGTTWFDISSSLASYYSLQTTDTVLGNLGAVLTYLQENQRVTGIFENGCSIITGVVASSELNNFISLAGQAVCASSFSKWIAATKESIVSKTKVVKVFFSRLCAHYAQGGLRGVIQFILMFARGGNSMRDEDGLLTFTDNKSLLPREFIVGIIGQLVGVVSAIIGMIVSAFSRVLGAIITVAASILWSVIGSAISTQSDTRASYVVIEDIDSEVALLPCLPMAMGQGEFDLELNYGVMQWYKDMVSLGSPVIHVQVPGGTLFIGPGGYTEDGSTVTKVRWEFHPCSAAFNFHQTRNYFGDFVSYSEELGVLFDVNALYRAGGSKVLESKWLSITSDQYARADNVCNDPGTGHMDPRSDKICYGSACFSTVIFYLWLMLNCVEYKQIFNHSRLNTVMLAGSASYNGLNKIFNDCSQWFGGSSTDLPTADWTNLTNCAINLCDVNDGNTIWLWDMSDDIDYDMSSGSLSFTTQNLITVGHFYGEANILPMKAEYEIRLPAFNSRTYWTWVAATALAVTAVAVTTIVATVKYKQFARRKRADNVAKYSDAQSTYQDAVKGYKNVIDPETGEVSQVAFDTSTPEGQQYIKDSYTAYKKTARSNNRWQKIIGGTRYDISTFYGEAEDPAEDVTAADTASSEASLTMKELLAEAYADTDDQSTDSTAIGPTLINLIKGFSPDPAT